MKQLLKPAMYFFGILSLLGLIDIASRQLYSDEIGVVSLAFLNLLSFSPDLAAVIATGVSIVMGLTALWILAFFTARHYHKKV